MKVDYTIVAGVLETLFLSDEPFTQGIRTYQFRGVVARLVKGLNDVTAIYEKMEFLKGEQDIADAMHLEATEKLENQMIEVQSICPHFTLLADLDYLICAICGKIVEDHHGG